MEIKYLAYLRDNPKISRFSNDLIYEPISLQEIAQLEQLYNNGNPFPKALKELLFLAGKYCLVLDYGLRDTQQGRQEWVRKMIANEGRSISRPFFAIDLYNAADQMLFIYLDEGDNPIVRNALYGEPLDEWLEPTVVTIPQLVTYRIDMVKKGENPF